MTIQRGRRVLYTRQQQMKHELIGLVIGSIFLLVGVAFLFNHAVEGKTEATDSAAVAVETNGAANPLSAATTNTASAVPAVNPVVSATADIVQTTIPNNTPAPVNPPPPIAETKADSAKSEPMMVAAAAITETNTAIATSPPIAPTGNDTKPAESAVSNATASSVPVVTMTATDTTEASPSSETVTDQDPSVEEKITTSESGWIYAGQFNEGRWEEKALAIGDQLPEAGQQYALKWDSIVRAAPPGRNSGGKMSKALANIGAGQKVTVLEVKNSGSKGHIWLKIVQ